MRTRGLQEAYKQNYSFLNVFDYFRPCERMRKHAFAGRNIHNMFKLYYPDRMISFENIHKINSQAMPEAIMSYKSAIQL